jgi:hypothetical protein
MIYDLFCSSPLSLISYLLFLIAILSLWIKQDIKVCEAYLTGGFDLPDELSFP